MFEINNGPQAPYTVDRHSFGLEQFCVNGHLDYEDLAVYGRQYADDQYRRMFTELRAIVAQGTQSQIRHEVKTVNSHVAFIPKTAFDWLKKLVVDFEPTLNFGWLKPEIISKTVPTHQEITKIFWNVYPLQQGEITYRGYWPDKIEWLTTMPPTDEQVRDGEQEARENAMRTAVSRFHSQPGSML